jgi:hypothetical protein
MQLVTLVQLSYEQVIMNEEQYDLTSGCTFLKRGLVVWHRAKEVKGARHEERLTVDMGGGGSGVTRTLNTETLLRQTKTTRPPQV